MRILKTPAGDVGIVENSMRTRQEIEAKLREMESDPLALNHPADAFHDALTVAFAQTALGAQILTLKWVLKMEATNDLYHRH